MIVPEPVRGKAGIEIKPGDVAVGVFVRVHKTQVARRRVGLCTGYAHHLYLILVYLQDVGVVQVGKVLLQERVLDVPGLPLRGRKPRGDVVTEGEGGNHSIRRAAITRHKSARPGPSGLISAPRAPGAFFRLALGYIAWDKAMPAGYVLVHVKFFGGEGPGAPGLGAGIEKQIFPRRSGKGGGKGQHDKCGGKDGY